MSYWPHPTSERDAARGLAEGITLRYIDKLEAEIERLRESINTVSASTDDDWARERLHEAVGA